jgi:solute carrier family 12 sodium/potassium/chloride transporter 2
VSASSAKKLGTFGGVFTPTVLTILGVIMYLRLGWVVGNGGLLGGLLVIGLAIGITAATGLSLSSISTNTRLGAGGPYAIISRSLGLEVGGSVGVPLYVSQALAVAMYIFGFREGWQWFFPDHPALIIDLVVFAAVFAIAYMSAEFAFRIQYAIMVVIAFSIVLILGSPAGWTGEVMWVGEWTGSPGDGGAGTDFWAVFAVFFPAATGIMAGANMSGDLENPRRAIPVGTMAAIALSTVVYVVLAVWVSRAGTAEELTSNYTFLVDASLWGPGVVAGLLGATLSSALTSLVGAPRILVALTRDGVVPDIGGIGQLSSSGEPRRAMIASGILVFGALMLRDLNAVAPLLSMFFLIAYGVINIVVLIESSLGLQSYRPTLAVPRIVPLLGAVGCIFAMFIVNPTVSLVSVGVVVGLYVFILRMGMGNAGDSRSGMFAAVAEWAAARATELEADNPRAWKPNFLVPVEDTASVRGSFQFLHELVAPEGSIKLIGIANKEKVDDVTTRMSNLTHDFRDKGVFTTFSVLDSTDLETGVVAGLQALGSAFFRPNVLFLSLPREDHDPALENLWRESVRLGVGLALFANHPEAGLGKRSVLHVWIPREAMQSPVTESLSHRGLHLALLLGLRLHRTWKARMRVYTVVEDESERAAAVEWLRDLADRARLPKQVSRQVLVGQLEDQFTTVPQSDLDIFALPPEPDIAKIRSSVELTRSACLFLGDSGKESVLA